MEVSAKTAIFLEILGHLWLTKQIPLAVQPVGTLCPPQEVIASHSPQIQEQYRR